MNHFWNATYSGVTWGQIATGYILAAILFVGLVVAIAKALSLRRKIKNMEWVKASQWSTADYAAMLTNEIDKNKALEARLNRIISRPRDKSGRFKGKGK